jgi:hypothetical protein
MKKLPLIVAVSFLMTQSVIPINAAVLTAIPGPDDQGGMIMPMISLVGTNLNTSFNVDTPPLLQSLSTWSPGDTFSPTASWYSLLDPIGGDGALFNNQFGFTFMANPGMGMSNVPAGKSLAIKLLSVSSNQLESWNYVNTQNRFDEVFTGSGSQVLWRGSMWHNYFTLPGDVTPGIYTAAFQVFITSTAFTSGTGFVDYSPSALNATMDTSYNPVTVNYSWEVVPEPSSLLLAVGGGVLLFLAIRKPRLS